ncbi:Alpha-galactosidase mel1 (Alpha-D-galactoside galactohydrolase) (Melibiase) [Durusdinium trenchii]|uniref:Alpha-galactosidase n=1 Tax=Durusdinium trenchii TaxID=1381693 RepID=A0ABP0QJE1_9DINO
MLRLEFLFTLAQALDDALVKAPPMGYNSWNHFGCTLNQEELSKTAASLKDLGFLELGYRYFVLDDCWMAKTRGVTLEADSNAFPSGIKDFGQKLHEMNFLFGIYTCRGVSTCEGRPSSRDHEEADAKAFAEWEVDFVKNDACWDPDCGPEQPTVPGSGICDIEGRRKAVLRYQRMKDAMNRTGRPMVHSLAGWQPWFAVVGSQLAHMWRVGADVKDWDGVYEATRIMEQLREYHGAQGWNDPDMLLGSSRGATLKLTPLQSRAQFSLWALMPAPLMLGANVLELSPYDALTYSNLEAIEINQDPLVTPAEVVYHNCPPYPRFVMGQRADGAPEFELHTNGVQDPGVVCGAHTAPNCPACCQGHGEGWCHGECEWLGERGNGNPDDDQNCVLSEKAKKKPAAENNPNPWQRKDLKESSMHQCQQVWVRRLTNGQVALVAVNFASKAATVDLPLSQLRLPWGDETPSILWDVWHVAKAPEQVHGHLKLALEANGGHYMLKLEQKSTQEDLPAKDFKEVSLRASLQMPSDPLVNGSVQGTGTMTEFVMGGFLPITNDGTGAWSIFALLLLVPAVLWFCRGQSKSPHRLD